MAKENWNRWGPEDQRGALNFIGPAETVAATGLVHHGTVISLAQTISPRMPTPAHRPGVMHFMDRDGGDYAAGARRPGGFQFAEDTIVLPLHLGTHIDGLCHVWCEDHLYNGFSGETIRSTTGASRCGVDKLTPIMTRGVLLDFCALRGGPLADGKTIERADIEAAAADIAIRPGDAVLLRTGWLESRETLAVDFNTEPGLGVDAALWLADQGVAIVGADNFAIEVLPFPAGEVFPVHQRLIRDYGIPLIEGLVLAPLAAAGAAEFLFVAAPLPIAGGTGSPLTPIAVI